LLGRCDIQAKLIYIVNRVLGGEIADGLSHDMLPAPGHAGFQGQRLARQMIMVIPGPILGLRFSVLIMNGTACSKYSDDADYHPEHIEDRVGEILFQDRTPRKHYCVNRVENPNEHERAGGTKPAYHAKTRYSHEDAYHLDRANMVQNE
jgi:hypothetical protein